MSYLEALFRVYLVRFVCPADLGEQFPDPHRRIMGVSFSELQ